MEQRSSLYGEQKRETKLSARVSRLTAFLDMGDVSLKIDEKLSTIPFSPIHRWKAVYNV